MNLDADPTLREPDFAEPRRRTLAIETDAGPAELAAVAFGDPRRPVDVVFLHANGFNALTYRSVLQPLGEHLHVLAVDQQGHGRSAQRTNIATRTNWLDLRDDVVALLDAVADTPVVLSGHSMGGAASLLAAAERPAKVKALALFDPVIMARETIERLESGDVSGLIDSPLALGARKRRSVFPSRAAAVQSYRGRGVFKSWSDAALIDYVHDGFRDRSDGQVELSCAPEWEASNFTSHAHDPWPAMAQIMAPVVVLRAQFESTCNLTDRSAFAPQNPNVRIETVAGATHFLPLERPELVRETLRTLAR
jgi:pimeloyl-ACP methyl ester carboxylesterase